MKRRDVLAALSLTALETSCSRSVPERDARDRFGGWPGLRFKATGYFRLERSNRWWLVTPEGNAFLSLGVSHASSRLLQQPSNAEFWLRKFGATDIAGPAFMKGYHQKIRDDMKAFGWNTLGRHTNVREFPSAFSPYVATCSFGDIPHWKEPTEKEFWDVFSPAFETHCDAVAREIALPAVSDPYLLGYSMTDCPIFTDTDAAARENSVYGAKRKGLPTWPRVLRNLAGGQDGKNAYVGKMRQLYRDDIGAFNQTYGTQFSSFAGLRDAADWRPNTDPYNPYETRDNNQFLWQVVERYYQVATRSIASMIGTT